MLCEDGQVSDLRRTMQDDSGHRAQQRQDIVSDRAGPAQARHAELGLKESKESFLPGPSGKRDPETS